MGPDTPREFGKNRRAGKGPFEEQRAVARAVSTVAIVKKLASPTDLILSVSWRSKKNSSSIGK